MPSTTTTTAEGGGEQSIALDTIARTLRYWIEYDTGQRAREGLTTDGDTHLIAPPSWPSHRVLNNWATAIESAALAAQSPPSRDDLYTKLMALRLQAAEFADEAADNRPLNKPVSEYEASERGKAGAYYEAAQLVKAAWVTGIPAGWKLVPVKATKAMIDAAYKAADDYEKALEPKGWGGLWSVYDALIAAAPAAPSATDGEGGEIKMDPCECKIGDCAKHYRQCLMERTKADRIRSAAPDAGGGDGGLAGQKPVAWAWEADFCGVDQKYLSYKKPQPLPDRRNIRPLYESPAAPVGDLAGLKPVEWMYEYHNGFEWLPNKSRTDPRLNRDPNAGAVRSVRIVCEAPTATFPAASHETEDDPASQAQRELAFVREMLLADQGDDGDTQILPDLREDMSLATMVARCISFLEYRRDVIKAAFDIRSVWREQYRGICEPAKPPEGDSDFNAKTCIAENFPQIASGPTSCGLKVTEEEVAKTIATAYGHAHPLGLTSGDGLEYWRANRDRHMKEAHAVLALLPAAHRQTVGADGWQPIEQKPSEADWIVYLPDGADDGLGWALGTDEQLVALLWWSKVAPGRSDVTHFRVPLDGPASPDAVQTNGGER